MFNNYLKTALRNLIKFKSFSLINIVGLAVGMGCAVLISLLVVDELNYEAFHLNADHIYRIVQDDYIGTPAALTPLINESLPEVVQLVRIDNFTRRQKMLFSTEEKKFYEHRFILADPSIFTVFSFRFIEGNPETALNSPNAIVLTKSAAAKYFGFESPIGKTLTLESSWDFLVTGVLQDIPENTHLKFDVLAPFSFNTREDRYGKDLDQNWGQANFVTYFLTRPEPIVEKAVLEEKINGILEAAGRARPGRSLYVQPLRGIHLKSNLAAEFEANSSVANIVFYSVIGFIILLIACLNSMNLSTARAIRRAKEVGIRKTVGAERSQLISQFFGEAFILSALALILGLFVVALILPSFNSLTGKHLSFSDSFFSIFLISAVTIIVTTTGSGIYPAIFLSSFKPVQAIKSAAISRSRGSVMRKILVVTQFSLSIIFLICTLGVWKQLNFIKNRNLGLNKEHVVNVPLHREVQGQFDSIKTDILRDPAVISASASNFPAFSPYHHGLVWEGMTEEDDRSIFWFAVDHDFVDTMGMEIVEGRNFSRSLETDTITAYLFNEAAVREFGMDFIRGRRFSVFGEELAAPVIGVVKDFNFMSLHERIMPLVLCVHPRYFNHISIKVDSKNIPAVISHLRRVWERHIPHRPFEYFFLDDRFDGMYKAEQRIGKLFSSFAILAILISCLGLLALASFMAEQRTKEIGVRKVLGASVAQISVLLSKDYLKWVLLANIISWPTAFIIMKGWLDSFAYRSTLGVEIFISAGLLALAIAQLTISYQSVKAALSDPVETLRYE